MKKLIIFLIRRHLGLKKLEGFTFIEQKSNNYYYFTDDALIKIWRNSGEIEKSHVSLNWLLDDKCVIVKEPTKNTNIKKGEKQ